MALAIRQEMKQLRGDAYLLGILWQLLREKIHITLSFGDFFTAMVHQRPLHVPRT